VGNSVVFKISDTSDETIKITSLEADTKLILLAGRPINEPVAWHGPFVMNTEEELAQAFSDYKNGKNGFEGSRSWKSKIKNLKYGTKFEDL
jgi:redox-sensitive bicupin YhaK (pirin superfamily)